MRIRSKRLPRTYLGIVRSALEIKILNIVEIIIGEVVTKGTKQKGRGDQVFI